MTKPAQYSYSIKFSAAALAVMGVLLALIFRNVWRDNTTFVWLIVIFCSLIFISLSAVLILKRLLPAVKGDVALHVDEDGISDFVKEISIEWKDVSNIELVRGRSASIMRVDLKWETDYGSQIAIYLRWVKGSDREIFETTRSRFEYYKQAHNN